MIYIVIVILLSCSIYVYINIRKLSKKYKSIHFKNDLCGLEIAEKLLESNGIDNIYIVETKNFLEEKYDVNRKVIKLLPSNFHGVSISNGLTAAYLAIYAIMDKKVYLLHIRNVLMFVMNILVYFSYILLFIAALSKNYEFLILGLLSLFIIMIYHILMIPLEKNITTTMQDYLSKLDLIDNNNKDVLDHLSKWYIYRFIALPISLPLSLFNLLK